MAGKSILVGAIDFGTTYSGWAFSFLHEFKSDPLKAYVKTWKGFPGRPVTEKTPTCLLIEPDGKTLNSFGYEAEITYSQLTASRNHEKYYFFQTFKMSLYEKLGVKMDRNMTIEDEMGRSLFALDVFAMAIKYLVDDMVHNVRAQAPIQESDIQWVLTVPAIWTDAAKEFMIEAAIKAGIDSGQLSIALEPEAASIYCRHLPVKTTANKTDVSVSKFKAGTKYMILDAGGGTIDITVHEVNKTVGIKEIIAPNGGGCGGTKVNKAFEDMLIAVFSKEVYDKFKAEETEDWFNIWGDFEWKKRDFDPTKNSVVVMHIPLSLIEIYKAVTTEELPKAIADSKFHGNIEHKRDKIKISAKLFRSFFKESIKMTVEHVKEGLKTVSVEAILMVGGYSESLMLQDAIKSNFPGIGIIIPSQASSTILRGALIYGHRPKSITERVKKTSVLTHKDIHRVMEEHLRDLPEKDRNLYDFGITRVTEESKKLEMKSVEVCFYFSVRSVNISMCDNPSSCFVVSHNGEGGFSADWSEESATRYLYRVVSRSIDEFLSWIGDLTKAAASGVGKAGRI